MDYYKQGVIEKKQQQQKEIMCYWTDENIYDWISKNNPNHELIEAIIYINKSGITSNKIADIYNIELGLQNEKSIINSFIIDHIIKTCNKYKCTFNTHGNFVNKNNLWFYDIDGTSETSFKQNNKYYSKQKEQKDVYITQLENKITKLEFDIKFLQTRYTALLRSGHGLIHKRMS